jgi:hypothetical protein
MCCAILGWVLAQRGTSEGVTKIPQMVQFDKTVVSVMTSNKTNGSTKRLLSRERQQQYAQKC